VQVSAGPYLYLLNLRASIFVRFVFIKNRIGPLFISSLLLCAYMYIGQRANAFAGNAPFSLCLNQHRMAAAQTPEQLAAEFGPRVQSIGQILPMLEPW
jgi:hypothetical protein